MSRDDMIDRVVVLAGIFEAIYLAYVRQGRGTTVVVP